MCHSAFIFFVSPSVVPPCLQTRSTLSFFYVLASLSLYFLSPGSEKRNTQTHTIKLVFLWLRRSDWERCMSHIAY